MIAICEADVGSEITEADSLVATIIDSCPNELCPTKPLDTTKVKLKLSEMTVPDLSGAELGDYYEIMYHVLLVK